MGLREPTPIQQACIGPTLQGRDVLGSAETGSGKTAAFALPIIQALSNDPYGVFAVVLSPARELASQIADQFAAFGAPMPVRVSVVVGGVDMMQQALELAQRPHVVVGTPGRLADHMQSGTTGSVLRKVRFLVIDEADRLLEQGFSSDLEQIISALPKRRQTLLYSATMSSALQRLQALALASPFVANLSSRETMVATLQQQYIFMPASVRDAYLVYLLREVRGEGDSVIVFTSTCRSCEVLAVTLTNLGLPCAALHSQQPQQRRLAAIMKLKQGSLDLIVATDVAARGLDIPVVSCVVNHNVPAAAADYIHRCGRTARAGRAGRAVTLVTQYDVELLVTIEDYTGTKLSVLEPPEDKVLDLLVEVASAHRAALLDLTDNGFLQREKARRAKKRQEQLARKAANESEAAAEIEAAEQPMLPSPPSLREKEPLRTNLKIGRKMKRKAQPPQQRSADESRVKKKLKVASWEKLPASGKRGDSSTMPNKNVATAARKPSKRAATSSASAIMKRSRS
eukprot:CAMPEP_0119349990 /NCGR_PEP_ID=MMETSP1333-20130426/109831_1 /TAXON_ID=418940 /ORGANISM="Scyphosphaera apsteinii, Strain RCC1455" /LENGTH=512 /DNA_ID=CAMNT_0007362597 /DNA_START=170 /DNA_END=1708 /DNA_ORIENTATION=-